MFMDYEYINEVWKAIPGFNGYYEASNYGRIKSLSRYVPDYRGFRLIKERIIKVNFNSKGYYQVSIYHPKTGKQKLKVHRLVAMAFIDNPNNKPQVNHINCIKTDNNVDNLEWCTNDENQKHACENGLKGSAIGSKSPRTNLTEEIVLKIKKTPAKTKQERVKVANSFGITLRCYEHIKYGSSWKHVIA
jgi:hypothetical protein